VLAVGRLSGMISLIPARLITKADTGRDSKQAREDPILLTLHAPAAVMVGLLVTVVWAMTGRDTFWPIWVWFGLGVSLGVHSLIRHGVMAYRGERPALGVTVELAALIVTIDVLVWGISGGGFFWPAWTMLGAGTIVGIHYLLVTRNVLPAERERQLVERVDELSRTRRGALDVQAAELRRIERDLHDGAQARLVALSMQLGRAEDKLEDRPEVAELVRRARDEASAAIKELRDLARGIAPPVLADRGLAAAVESLGQRSAIEVDVDAALKRRLSPVIEAAAYFVVAEALTNVAKHAPGAAARVTLGEKDDVLVLEIADDGPGGALESAGDGTAATGLAGLRRRVEALDGTLRVTSPAGVGTAIRAELPCVS
jgi:signal transduction histidine kinase